MKYRIPYFVQQPKAKNKAAIAYWMQAADNGVGGYSILPCRGCRFAEFDAATHAEAGRMAQRLIVPGDDRPIKGRCMIKFFAVEED